MDSMWVVWVLFVLVCCCRFRCWDVVNDSLVIEKKVLVVMRRVISSRLKFKMVLLRWGVLV